MTKTSKWSRPKLIESKQNEIKRESQSGICRRKWKKGTLKFTASDRCPHTFLHKINTSGVKIRPVLK